MSQVGHLDPYFLTLMEQIKSLMRYTYQVHSISTLCVAMLRLGVEVSAILLTGLLQTKNDFTVPVSGTGSAAMEACVANMIEPGFCTCLESS